MTKFAWDAVIIGAGAGRMAHAFEFARVQNDIDSTSAFLPDPGYFYLAHE
jgi:hypothetical protein